MDKSADAFRTISEVAEDLDLPQHVLRFWETRFKQIKPMKRGGGRRYYRPDDVDLLRGIKGLLYEEGYTIRGVQRLLKEHGNRVAITFAQTGQIIIDEPVDNSQEVPPAQPALELEELRRASNEGAKTSGLLGKLANVARGGAGPEIGETSSIGANDVEVLKRTLQDLLECKRLLDQTRQN